ncbi:clostripain-related cysteine peptidase [Pseudobutyrivibrio sp. UC1225]|uniref:clostripain-related cysteine peptidase n=1 Tax=Pseudobutyrivibrio sp. UC1225 TaxID=1798185 RepID=UPI000B8443F9|nr:clostripain-related cysteine peptidase [Pseudobutyrivibrio sp. UC1225]
MADRPVSRKKNVTGSGSVNRRGSGLGSGPVGGGAGGHVPGGSGSGGFSGNRDGGYGGGGGLGKLIIIALVVLLGGGGGLGAFLGGGSGGTGTGSLSGDSATSTINTIGTMASLLLGSGGYTSTAASGNSSWSSKANTGILDETVAEGARQKYTLLKGDGKDTTTIMVYMCGTDLESRGAMASKDLQEMLNATVADNINLIVYTGGSAGWKNNFVSNKTNQIYQIKNGKMNLIKDNLGDLPMTDPNTLSSFIKWGAQNYKADRYDLIFWDHGGGSVTGYGYDEKHREAGSMNLAGINKALTDGGLKYDFVGFDACLMATVETGLMLDAHSDYMIASEETEPGIGWYYTNWLTELSKNPSMSTLEIGKNIVDDFVAQCGQQCAGQKTTLSVVDLAELTATVPEDLKSFADSTASLIDKKEYKVVSNARSSTREFATSSRIDQIDLIDFAIKMDNEAGTELASSLKGAVKYNKTSSNMTNAYGLSIYFPYRQTSKVDNMVDTYDEIGMDESYSNCIQKFASMAYYGQNSTTYDSNPASMLFGAGNTDVNTMNSQAIASILNAYLSSSGSSSPRFLNNGVSVDDAAEYIANNNISNVANMEWTLNSAGQQVISLDEDQWENVQEIEFSTFVDDGEGYIDLGLDNVFEWDDDNNLIANTDRSWLAIDGQIVAYYHIDTTGDSSNYTITGRVPVLLNDERADLILVFDSEHEDGYVAGATYDYKDGETEVIAKNLTELEPGDTLDFISDYYDYSGRYTDSYFLGEQMTVSTAMEDMKISNLVIEDKDILISYVFTDIYGNSYYTEGLSE